MWWFYYTDQKSQHLYLPCLFPYISSRIVAISHDMRVASPHAPSIHAAPFWGPCGWMAKPFTWDFEARNVTFKLRVLGKPGRGGWMVTVEWRWGEAEIGFRDGRWEQTNVRLSLHCMNKRARFSRRGTFLHANGTKVGQNDMAFS